MGLNFSGVGLGLDLFHLVNRKCQAEAGLPVLAGNGAERGLFWRPQQLLGCEHGDGPPVAGGHGHTPAHDAWV